MPNINAGTVLSVSIGVLAVGILFHYAGDLPGIYQARKGLQGLV